MEETINKVRNERKRQNEKWGIQDHNPVEWIAILTEEVGEASKESVDFHFGNGLNGSKEANDFIQKDRVNKIKTELIQVAAVAIQAVESIERQAF